MASAVENFTFNELPRRLVVDSSLPTGSSLTAGWVLVASGIGFQAIPTDPAMLGFEPTVAPATGDPTTQYYRGDKTWQTLDAGAVGAIAASEKGVALGVATLDADGYVSLSQMNPSVIERVVIVADEAARYALTTADVQNGDVVNQQSPLPATMWFVVDDTNLNNSAGYLPFSAGVAASVAWSGITGKPAIIGDLEDIALADEGDVIQYVAGQWVNVDVSSFKASLSITISDVTSLQSELDLKQSQSTVLDNLSAISTPGIVVRTVDGDFIGRELVGINGITVTEGSGEADNPSISLTETGVTAGTYGGRGKALETEIDVYGRVLSIQEMPVNSPINYLSDVATEQLLVSNGLNLIGSNVASRVTYSSNLQLKLPATPLDGEEVLIRVSGFVNVLGIVTLAANVGQTIMGISALPLTSDKTAGPLSEYSLVYDASVSKWTFDVKAGYHNRLLTIVNPSTTDVEQRHSFISGATEPRAIYLPDADVDLFQVGKVDFLDSEFRVSDDADPAKKLAFSVGGITSGQTRVVTIPDSNVDLGLVGQTDFLDTAFRVSDNTDPTKKIAFEASGIGTNQTKTITMPNVDVDLGLVGQTDFLDTAFRVSDNTDATKKIAFEASGIGTGQTKTITMPNFDVSLSPIRRRIQTAGAGLENLLLDNTETYIEITDGTTITIPVYPPYTSNAGASGYLFNATNVAKTIRFRYTWSGEISSFVGTCNHFFPETNETGSYTSTAPGSSGSTYTDIQLLPGETLRFVVSGTKTLFTVNIYRNSSNVMYENTFKIKRSALESHGVRFETSAVTTDRVITMPDANVDLGQQLISSSYSTSTGLITFGKADGTNTTVDMSNVRRYVDLPSGIAAAQPNINTLFKLNGGTSVNIGPLSGGKSWEFHTAESTSLILTGGGSKALLDTENNILSNALTSYTIGMLPFDIIKVTSVSSYWIVEYVSSRTFNRSGSLGLVSTTGAGAGSTKYKTSFVHSSGTAFTADTTVTLPATNVDLGDLPSVATNDRNNLSGTRCRILGGSNNNVSGTDNVAIGCTSCTLTGNSQVITSGGYVTDITQAGGHIQSTLGELKQGQMIRVTVCLSGATIWGTHMNTACTNGGLYSATTVPKTFLNAYGYVDGYTTSKTVAVHKLRIIGRNRNMGGSSVGNDNLFIGERTVIYEYGVGLTITTVGTDYVSGSPVTLNITNDGGKLKIAPVFNNELTSTSGISSVWEVFVDSIYTNY